MLAQFSCILDSYQVCEIISTFSAHQSGSIAETSYVVNVAVHSDRVRLEHNKD